MTPQKLAVGMLVVNARAPKWGPGKVLGIAGSQVKVYFRDRQTGPGDNPAVTLRLPDAPLEPAPEQSDPWLDQLPVDRHGKIAISRHGLGLPQTIRTFLTKFPLGFRDPAYLEEERNYKLAAHNLWVETRGNGQGEALLESGDTAETTRRAQRVLRDVNLVNIFEGAAFRDGLKCQGPATAFFRGLFNLLASLAPEEALFEALAAAVHDLPAAKGRSSPDKWAVATILPFLARPDTFMFLKPEITKRFAEMLNFNLAYDPHPNWRTYRRLLKLGELLIQELRPMGAQDWIDVQSFMFVVGDSDAPSRTQSMRPTALPHPS